jgi:hypothetical protein
MKIGTHTASDVLGREEGGSNQQCKCLLRHTGKKGGSNANNGESLLVLEKSYKHNKRTDNQSLLTKQYVSKSQK